MFSLSTPQKHLASKTYRAYILRRHRAIGNGESALEELMCRFTYPGPQSTNSNLKSAQAVCEGVSFADLKTSARGTQAC